MKKVIRLTESDLTRIVKKVISEEVLPEYDQENPKPGKLVQGDKNGNGVLKWKNAKYYGELKNGRMNGKGSLYIDYDNYKRYVKGQFSNDKFNGPIEYKDSDGEAFKGNYKDGKWDGYGEHKFYDGGIYKGNYKDDYQNGYGEYKYPNGATYKGNWEGNLKNGYGIQTYSDGTTFKGKFKDGYKNGYGEFKFPNGGTLKGNFKDDAINGYGIETWSDGSTYKGNYKDGYKHGHGEVKFVNGATYKGNFKDDFWGGYGIYTNPHGIKFEGNFKDGYINGKTTEDLDKIKTQPKAVVKQKSKTIKLPKLSPDQICTLEGDKRWSYAKTIDGKWYASKDKVNWYDISSNKKATSILNADGACKSISKIPSNPVEPSTDSKETFIPTDDIEFGNEKIPNWVVPFYK